MSIVGWLVLCLVPRVMLASLPLPKQVHLTVTGNPREMAVSWAEMGDYSLLRSEVRFGTAKFHRRPFKGLIANNRKI